MCTTLEHEDEENLLAQIRPCKRSYKPNQIFNRSTRLPLHTLTSMPRHTYVDSLLLGHAFANPSTCPQTRVTPSPYCVESYTSVQISHQSPRVNDRNNAPVDLPLVISGRSPTSESKSNKRGLVNLSDLTLFFFLAQRATVNKRPI